MTYPLYGQESQRRPLQLYYFGKSYGELSLYYILSLSYAKTIVYHDISCTHPKYVTVSEYITVA